MKRRSLPKIYNLMTTLYIDLNHPIENHAYRQFYTKAY